MNAAETKLIKIEKELVELKKMVMRESTVKKKVTLKGLLKGLETQEEDFILAKKSFSKIGNWIDLRSRYTRVSLVSIGRSTAWQKSEIKIRTCR